MKKKPKFKFKKLKTLDPDFFEGPAEDIADSILYWNDVFTKKGFIYIKIVNESAYDQLSYALHGVKV